MKAKENLRSRVMSFVERQGKSRVLIASLVLVAILGIVDFSIGFEIAFAQDNWEIHAPTVPA